MVCRFTFHGELTFFFADASAPHHVDWPVTRRASVKDVIESLGVPHTEVGSLALGTAPVDFTHLAAAGQQLQVHPPSFPIDVHTPTPLRPTPLPALRFLADANVGRLAKSLRMLGFDTAWSPHWEDGHIAAMAETERRVVLTKDRGLLKRKQVAWGRCIRHEAPEAQLQEVITVFGLAPPYAAFSRCIACNEILQPIDKAAILHRLQPKTKQYYHTFTICPACDRIYWPGSHYAKAQAHISAMRGSA